MQNKKQTETLSRLRHELRRLLSDLEQALRIVSGRQSLVKGNVYELARKCGKPSCACARGALHRGMVLSWSHQGRTKLMSVPPGRLAELRSKSGQYLRHRQARARITKICRRMLALIDRLEKLRREDP